MGIYNGKDGWGYVQFLDGGPITALGKCTTVDTLNDPQEGSDPVYCLDEHGRYTQVGETTTPPSQPTFAVMELIEQAASIMEQIKEARCRFNFYFTLTNCGNRAIWNNQQRAYAYKKARILDNPINNARTRDADTTVESAWNMQAFTGRGDHREVVGTRVPSSETVALNDISACPWRCGNGACTPVGICENMVAAADAVNYLAVAEVLESDDTGATWTGITGPFAAGENVMAVQCVQVDATTSRWIVVRDTDAANPLETAYSDDGGATWTTTTVGSTNGEAAYGGGSLFALDYQHIWLCTDDGRVFFSNDGSATWTDQTTALSASSANALRAIHFADSNVGYAVGASDTIVYTLDGGDNWSAGTATGSGDGLNTVHVFNQNRVIVGTDSVVSDSPLYMTFDATANWTTITEGLDIAVTDTVEDVSFMQSSGIAGLDDLTGYLIKNTSAPVGTVYKSIDGGRTWQAITTPSNSGLNSIYVCHANQAFAVGEADSGTSMIVSVG